MYLELRHIKKRFGEKNVVQDLSLTLNKGELLCILGSSGCGKTTTLNIVGGFLSADSGQVILDEEDITNLPAERRPVSTVFQSYSLFPHMTVLRNMTLAPTQLLKKSQEEAEKKAEEVIRVTPEPKATEPTVAETAAPAEK